MTAPEDKQLFHWLFNANRYGGSFIRSMASAAMFADEQNYAIIRPVLVELSIKYDKYFTMGAPE